MSLKNWDLHLTNMGQLGGSFSWVFEVRDLEVRESEPHIELTAVSTEPTWDLMSLPCLPLPHLHTLSQKELIDQYKVKAIFYWWIYHVSEKWGEIYNCSQLAKAKLQWNLIFNTLWEDYFIIHTHIQRYAWLVFNIC